MKIEEKISQLKGSALMYGIYINDDPGITVFISKNRKTAEMLCRMRGGRFRRDADAVCEGAHSLDGLFEQADGKKHYAMVHLYQSATGDDVLIHESVHLALHLMLLKYNSPILGITQSGEIATYSTLIMPKFEEELAHLIEKIYLNLKEVVKDAKNIFNSKREVTGNERNREKAET